MDGGRQLLLLDTQADANAALAEAQSTGSASSAATTRGRIR
jgi:hypothetical protein